MKKIILGILMVIFMVSIAFGQDFTFRGIKFGRSIEEQDKSLDFKSIPNESKVRFLGDFGDKAYVVNGLADIGTKENNGSVITLAEKVEWFEFSFYTDGAQLLAELVSMKYGEPTTKKDSPLTTYGGAILNSSRITWILDDGASIVLTTRNPTNIKFGGLRVQTKKMLEHCEEKLKDFKQKALKGL